MRHPKRQAALALTATALILAACGSKSNTPATSNTTATSTTKAASGSTSTAASGTTSSSTSAAPQPPSSPTSLSEAGSSLLYPLFQLWAPAYKQVSGTVTTNPAAGGSGKGIAGATDGTLDIGASDAYLSPSLARAHADLENIPLAISAQQVNYNLPGVGGHLRLDGKVLSAIYQGKVTSWDDPQIKALNAGVSLPATKIVPLHRSDASGDTFLFTQYLSKSDPSGWGSKYQFNTAYPGPAVPGALAENGNGGMVTGCQHTPGCVAYIGISYLAQTNAAGLGEAMLANQAGTYLLPTPQTISTEAAGFAAKTPPDESVSLIYGPATQGYPIINYEYAVVKTDQPSSAKARALKAFLYWASDPAQGGTAKYLDAVRFIALPASVVSLTQAQIDKIK